MILNLDRLFIASNLRVKRCRRRWESSATCLSPTRDGRWRAYKISPNPTIQFRQLGRGADGQAHARVFAQQDVGRAALLRVQRVLSAQRRGWRSLRSVACVCCGFSGHGYRAHFGTRATGIRDHNAVNLRCHYFARLSHNPMFEFQTPIQLPLCVSRTTYDTVPSALTSDDKVPMTSDGAPLKLNQLTPLSLYSSPSLVR